MSTLREVQLCGLKILKEVVAVCEKNNLTYYLGWGTLLGAIRHKGFIPWDNDIDILMPIDDYRRFLRLAERELPSWLFLQTYQTDRGYNEMWAKVRANGTTSMPVAWKEYKIHLGIGIDIFPIIGRYRSERMQNLQMKVFGFCRTLLAKEYLEAIHSPELNSENKKLKLLYRMPWVFRIMVCKCSESFVFKSIAPNGDVSLADLTIGDKMPAPLFGSGRKVTFEDRAFVIPSDYNRILIDAYGEDYMTPPPPEERGYGHELSLGKIIYDCEKDYREYL